MAEIRELAKSGRAWPFEEARKLLERTKGETPEKGYVLFETGYGPSGLPHIGTFGEVVRTTMVRRAFSRMSDIPTRLFTFSDDMDGLRKVPENVPNQEMLSRFAEVRDKNGQATERGGVSLTDIPDPFGDCHESFGHHNNAQLRSFLDAFGFDYEFQSATDWYRSGRFDEILLATLRHIDEIIDVVLPTLGPERRKTYCPFLPISPASGRVLHVPANEIKADRGTIVFPDENGDLFEAPVTGGRCKLQWKVDWAMRWVALGVDYEMSGKDLIDSVKLSSLICRRILKATPPETFIYELFLDENGEKISKSKGNGLTVEEWLRYAPPESLALFMYRSPRKAKRLYFDVIPRQVDDYLASLGRFEGENEAARIENPAWHIHAGPPPREKTHLSFNVLLHLASVCHAEDKNVLWGFISRYAPEATPENDPILDSLVAHAVTYYWDFVKPGKRYRLPDGVEKKALADLAAELQDLPEDADAETIQTRVYEVGKRHPFLDMKAWFAGLYEILLGQEEGPRMGSFIALYGIAETIGLIERAIAGEDLAVG